MTYVRPNHRYLSSLLGQVNHYLAVDDFGFFQSLFFHHTIPDFSAFFFFFRLISILYDYCQILASLWAPPCSNFWYEMCQNVDLWIVDSYLSFTGNITLVSLLCHCHWVYYSSYC